MANYRQKITVQKKVKEPKAKFDPFIKARKTTHDETRTYIKKALLMYREVVVSLEPLSDAEKLCRDEILKYTIDLEILEKGTYEEAKEVVVKYGGIIGKTIYQG